MWRWSVRPLVNILPKQVALSVCISRLQRHISMTYDFGSVQVLGMRSHSDPS